MVPDLVEDHGLLRLVAVLDGGEQRRLEAGAARGVDQGLHVLGEARPAVAGAGIDEVIADALVGADALADHLDVGPEPLGEAGHLVHEADLGRQHGVGGIFGQLGRAHVHDDDLVVVAVEGGVDLAQHLLGLRARRADHDPVGAHAVGDRRTLLEELGVGDHMEAEVGAVIRAARGELRLEPARAPCRRCRPARWTWSPRSWGRSCAGRWCRRPPERTADPPNRPRRGASPRR